MEWQNGGRQLRWKDKMKAGTLGGLVGNDQWPARGTAMAFRCTNWLHTRSVRCCTPEDFLTSRIPYFILFAKIRVSGISYIF